MKGYFNLVAKTYPSFAPLWKETLEAKTPLDDLRRQIWHNRAQYWYRKFGTIKPTWAQAKVDACYALKQLKSPSQISYRHFGVGLVWGVQVYGCWKLGEIIARENIGGYPVGDWHGAPHMKNHN